ESAVKFICGEYGAGKTFLLKRARIEAERQGFVVSSVKINQGFRLNLLNHLYYNIMHNLSFKDAAGEKVGFEDLTEDWLRCFKRYTSYEKKVAVEDIVRKIGKYNESMARAVREYIWAAQEDDRKKMNGVISWLTGEENITYEIKSSFKVTGTVDRLNAIDFLKGFSAFLKLMGFAGLVVLVDELELVMDERVDIRKKAYENLRFILDECSMGQPESTIFIFAATQAIINDRVKGIPSYQALSQRLGNPADKVNSSLSDMRQPLMYLPPFHYEDLSELSIKIIKLHKELYNCGFQISEESIINWALLLYKEKEGDIEKVNIRKYIMKLTEVLDIMEQHPKNPMFKTELTMMKINGNITFKNMRMRA
ncbi:MAG: DUF2791 family P-loop domain-containing protein, partial [Firmicutes bacterium]|nr:DUF2791 family P-loop domain-containing protein [Bacillota bacterium]